MHLFQVTEALKDLQRILDGSEGPLDDEQIEYFNDLQSKWKMEQLGLRLVVPVCLLILWLTYINW
jgi:hypothetical protein